MRARENEQPVSNTQPTHHTRARTRTRVQPCPFTIVSSSDGTTQLFAQAKVPGKALVLLQRNTEVLIIS